MLYTSYFSRQRNNKVNSLYAITVNKPSWFIGNHLKIVAPTLDLLNRYKQGITSEEEYTEEYLAMLENNKETILISIRSLPDESILLCYEGPGKFCHRHILSDWLRKQGIQIEEKENLNNGN